MSSFVQRMLGAAKLDAATFEEVEADGTAVPQALGVVVLAAIAAGIGAIAYGGMQMMIVGVLASIIGWAIWAALIWLLGTKLLPEPQTRANWGEVARTTGFAQSPGLLRVFGFIPVLGPIIVFVASIWSVVAMVIAVRQALDYTQTWRAVVVVMIGWVINIALFAFSASLGVSR